MPTFVQQQARRITTKLSFRRSAYTLPTFWTENSTYCSLGSIRSIGTVDDPMMASLLSAPWVNRPASLPSSNQKHAVSFGPRMNRSVVSHVRRLVEGNSRGVRFQPQRPEALGESALVPNSSRVGCGIQQRRGKRPVVCPFHLRVRSLCECSNTMDRRVGHRYPLFRGRICPKWGIPSSLTRTGAIRIAILSELTGSAFRASGAAFTMKHQGFSNK
jgi:hypothetical protein